MKNLAFTSVNKLVITGLNSISQEGCDPSREQKTSTANCKNSFRSNWFSNGRAMETFPPIPSDGKLDCNWLKKQAIESGSDIFGYPVDEEIFRDRSCKGHLNGFDNK
jgi:hypothetical protein